MRNEIGEYVQEKGNMDVEITLDAIKNIDAFNTAVLFTGDSDFLALLTHLKNNGKDVHVFSSKNNISKELRTSADTYIDLLKIREDIWGKHIEKRQKT